MITILLTYYVHICLSVFSGKVEASVISVQENIEHLMSMGFDMIVTNGVLIRARNNLQVAINSLCNPMMPFRTNNE